MLLSFRGKIFLFCCDGGAVDRLILGTNGRLLAWIGGDRVSVRGVRSSGSKVDRSVVDRDR